MVTFEEDEEGCSHFEPLAKKEVGRDGMRLAEEEWNEGNAFCRRLRASWPADPDRRLVESKADSSMPRVCRDLESLTIISLGPEFQGEGRFRCVCEDQHSTGLGVEGGEEAWASIGGDGSGEDTSGLLEPSLT
jgi:hypothetical protein